MLTDFISDCDSLNISGIEVDIWFSCAKEHAKTPRSKAQMPTPTNAPGDKNRIGENYDFTGAPAGEGYWRKMTVIADTGMVDTKGAVKDGTTSISNDVKFKLKSFGPVEKEFAENVAACCGMVLLVTDKNTVTHEIGTPRNPATVSKFEGGTGGDFRGFDYEIMSKGRTPRTFDLMLFPLDITPNV
jgi:hypothetical protein